MPYSRNDYLKTLARMRFNYQNSGNPLVNPEDDNGNVGNELSSFAYMNTELPQVQENKNERNGWQRTVDTTSSAISNVTEGVSNFLDDVWDFSVTATSWLTGLVSGLGSLAFGEDHDFSAGWEAGTSYVEPLTTYEWEQYLNNTWNQLNVGNQVLTGDIFTKKYWENWGNLGDKTMTEELHKNSWANEMGKFGQGAQKVEQGIGYVLPSLVLAYFTGGSSLGAQVAIQAGVAGATAMGGGVEKALKEGANYGEAMGYGATKGAISAGTTAVLVGVGGSVVSKSGSSFIGKGASKVGESVFKATGSRGAEVFASKAVEIASRAGMTYASSFASQLTDPVVQSIYDNGNAIAEAYGDNEKIKQYLARCHSNATTSAITTAIISAGREGVDLARRGTDGYMANYYSQKALGAQKYVEKELKNINRDLQNGKITEQQAEVRLANLDKYNATVERYGKIALEYAEKIYNNAQTKTETVSNEQGENFEIKAEKGKLDFGRNKDVMQRLAGLGYSKAQTDFITKVAKQGFSKADVSKDSVSLLTDSGDMSVHITPNGQEIEVTVNNKTYNVPAIISDNKVVLNAETNANVSGIVAVLGSRDTRLLTQADVEPSALNIPTIKADGINTNQTLTISKDVSNKILDKANSNMILEFLESETKLSDNFVIKQPDSENYIVIEPFGDKRFGAITINSKTNEIVDISVKQGDATKLMNSQKYEIISKTNTKGVEYKYDNGTIKEQNQDDRRQATIKGDIERYGKQSEGIRKILDNVGTDWRDIGRLGVIASNGHKYLTGLLGNNFHKYFSAIHKKFGKADQVIVDLHDISHYKEGVSFIREDGKAVGFVEKGGNIISVANGNTKVRGFTQDFLKWAVKHGGNHMDCMASTKDNTTLLPHIYSKSGFKVVAKVKYDRAIMLQDHPVDYVNAFERKYGKADLLFMAYTGSNEPVYKSRQACRDAIEKLPYDDYDTALAKQQKAVSRLPEKVITDIEKQSSVTLIEAGADVSKAVKYRLKSVKQAFINALEEITPKNATYKIDYQDYKSSYAELDLAKPSDMDTAVNNMIAYLSRAKVTFVLTTGYEKTTLGDILTDDQIAQAREIMVSTLKGKAEPTKLAKWVKSLKLERLEKQEIKRNVVLMNKLQRRIKASKTLNFGYGDAPTAELSVFENIIQDLPRFWTNKSVIQFANNIVANYNENNLKSLFEDYGIVYDENIYELAKNLKEDVIVGQHLSPLVQARANDLLQLLFDNLETVDSKIKSVNVKQAEHDDNVVEALYFGKQHNSNVVSGGVKNVLNAIDTSITAPADFFKRKINGTELSRFVNEDTGKFENRELELNNKYDKLVDDIFTKKIARIKNQKVTFNGEKTTYGVLLDRLNDYKTLGDKFFNAKGAKTNVDKTRGEIDYTPEDIARIEELLPEELIQANNDLLKMLNTDLRKDIASLYKEVTHTDLHLLDEESIWYNITRVSDSFSGVSMGGTSFRDMNLSFLNKRVNSKADLNFNLDVVEHVRNYIHTAVKKLVWQPYVNKLNTLLNTRVYGRTNYKTYQMNVPNFDKELDLLFHQIMGVPYERDVSTVSNIAGKIIRNLNVVRVSTIQTGLRTISSAPFFAKYFGASTAVKGVVQNIKNGDVFSLRRNYKVITKYSPYFKNRFSSDEVLFAETGLKQMNKTFRKIFGTPLRMGDAYVHLGLGFAMAQVKAQEQGYGKPWTDENNKRAVYLLEQASKTTQPTNAVGHIAGFRYGNSVFKYLFGLYGSMKQQFADGLIASSEDILTYKSRANAIQKSIAYHDDKIAEYEQLAKDYKETMENTFDEEEFKDAQKNYEKYNKKAESHRKAKENTEKFAKEFDADHTTKKNFDKVIGGIGGLIVSSLLYVAINYAIKMWEGKKSIKDVTLKDIGIDTLEQSFLNSLPYISTIYASIKNNSDLSIATIDNLNNTLDAVKSFVKAIESQEGGKITGSSLKLIGEIANYFGIPLQSLVKLVNGTWYNIDKDSNLQARNWLGMVSASSLKSNYNDAVKKNQPDRAKANLEVWLYNYSVSSSNQAVNEIYRLNSAGYTGVTPSAIPSTYTNENGEQVQLTSAQVSTFRSIYSQASTQADELIKSTEYQALDDEYKAKVLKRVYDAYYQLAKNAVFGTAPSGKLALLMYHTNGDIDLAKYIASLQKLSLVTETKFKSKKENVLAELNRMKGFTRQEKLLLAYLSGYTPTDVNKNMLVAYLTKNGFTRKEALSFLG